MSNPLMVVPNPAPRADHLDFLRRRALDPGSQQSHACDLELVAPSGAAAFWEIVGLRIQGHDLGILGALEFRRQVEDPDSLARQSLAAYLASPPHVAGSKELLGPNKLIALQVPAASESVADFLSRLSVGGLGSSLLVDPDLIQVGFDFRSQNPSLDKRSHTIQLSWQTVALRTVEGHVLTGALLDLRMKLCRSTPFVALVRVVQHTPECAIPLPTVFIHREYISMMTAVAMKDPIDNWIEDSVPLSAFSANPEHLLDPRL